MFRITAITAILCIVSVFSFNVSAQITPQQYELLLASSVKLRVDADNIHSWGTGTIIDARSGEALILTCGHIFRERIQQNNNTIGNLPVEVHLYGGRVSAKVDGFCLFCDLETDIALIAVKPPFPVQAVAVAPEDYFVQNGQTVWSSGCGGGANPSIEQHRIMSLDKISPMPKGNNAVPFHYIQVSGAPVSGRSGGGLFTADNYLIGVCNTGDPQNNDGQFVPPEVIRQILKSMKLETVYERPSLGNGVQNEVAATLLPLKPIAESEETIPRSPLPIPNSVPNTGINNIEQATLEEIQRRVQDGDEVILIVRSRRNPEIPSDVIVLNGTSDQFLNQLAQGVKKTQPEAAVYSDKYANKYESTILASPLPPVQNPLAIPQLQPVTQSAQQPVSFPVLHR